MSVARSGRRQRTGEFTAAGDTKLDHGALDGKKKTCLPLLALGFSNERGRVSFRNAVAQFRDGEE